MTQEQFFHEKYSGMLALLLPAMLLSGLVIAAVFLSMKGFNVGIALRSA